MYLLQGRVALMESVHPVRHPPQLLGRFAKPEEITAGRNHLQCVWWLG